MKTNNVISLQENHDTNLETKKNKMFLIGS